MAKLKNGTTSLPEALSVASQIAQALNTVHEHGIVHGDVKPSKHHDPV